MTPVCFKYSLVLFINGSSVLVLQFEFIIDTCLLELQCILINERCLRVLTVWISRRFELLRFLFINDSCLLELQYIFIIEVAFHVQC